MEKIILKVDGMHCEKCKSRLEDFLNKKSDIKKATVNLEEKSVEIEYDNITKNDIEGYIEDIGFKSLGE